MNKKALAALALVVLLSGAISFSLLTRGHSWLDDFASYVMQAKSILDGTMDEFVRRNAFTVTGSSYPPGPAAYPWGFPLLLAPVYTVFGMHALAFKLLNTLFYALFLLAFFALARTRLGNIESLLLAMALAFNPALLLAHDYIISDIPFLFFCTLGLFLIKKFIKSTDLYSLKETNILWLGLATGSAIFAGAFIRTNGILLLIPLVLGHFLQFWPQRRLDWKPALTPYLTFGVLFAAQALLFPNGQDSYLSHFSMFNPARLWDNFIYYLWLPSWMFREFGGELLYPFLMVFVLVSIAQHGKRHLPLHVYSLSTVTLYILWPERQGLRFIYPVLPLLLIFAFDGMKLLVERLKPNWQKPAGAAVATFWLLLAVVSLGVSAAAARDNLSAGRAINGPFDPVSGEMFEFLREKTPPESVIVFFRPRALRLFTDRDAFMTERCADLPKGDYLALSKKVDDNGQIPPGEATACPQVTLEQVYSNRRFVVYRINLK